MRKRIVAGNWKMNMGHADGLLLASSVIEDVKKEPLLPGVIVVLAPSYIHLKEVVALTVGTDNVFVAAQNCHWEKNGAYTGEVSPDMLASLCVKYVIVGHSERRSMFGETNEILKMKVDAVLSAGLIPIFCVGETLNERKSEIHFTIVKNQLLDSLFHLPESQMPNIVIAYEPVWAIGTGLNASADQAQEMHLYIRTVIGEKYGSKIAESVSILYGGSCKPDNAESLFACADVDGGLIGGASLKAPDFLRIVKKA